MGLTGSRLRGDTSLSDSGSAGETGPNARAGAQERFLSLFLSVAPGLLVLVQNHIKAVLRNKVQDPLPGLPGRRALLTSVDMLNERSIAGVGEIGILTAF